MKFAYADPPYLGLAAKFYADQHPDATAYDRIETHAALVKRLCADFPDGWAMSLQSKALRAILPLCPEDVRVMAWVKTWASFKPGVSPAYVWEPVILRGGRKHDRSTPTVRDWMACPATSGRGFRGAKPDALAWWIFRALGARRGDEMHDLFPGSGAIGRAWEAYVAQGELGSVTTLDLRG